MKVILTQDVAKIGRRYDIKEVADGFGRNYLITRGVAVIANATNLKKLEQWKSKQAAEDQLSTELLAKSLAQLDKLVLVIRAKASPEGHLFAGIHQKEIAAALQSERQVNLPASSIQLDQPIKTVGEHQIKVKTGPVSGQFTLKIEALEK